MPVIYVRDKNFNVIRIEESFSSLVWTERYQEAGDFVLDIPLDVANFDVYIRGNYIQLDESDETMIIESVNVEDDSTNPLLEISGRSLACILERRINASKAVDLYTASIKYNGDYGTVVEKIIEDDVTKSYMIDFYWQHRTVDGTWEDGYERGAINKKKTRAVPTPYRDISNFDYSNLVTGVTINKEFSQLKSIYDILLSFSKAYVTGFRVRLQNGNFVLETYKGTDRTSAVKKLDPVIFNPVMDNISYVNYFEDQTDYRNICLSYSDAPWSPVDFNASFLETWIFDGYAWVADEDNSDKDQTNITGLDRYELAVDARSSASVSSWDPSEYYYPDDTESEDEIGNIMSKVIAVATDEFDTGDHDFVKTSEGAIDPLVRYEFGKDYFLGDTVEISNDRGIVMIALIDEVVRSYDSSGFVVTPNFKSMEDYDYGEEETS